MKKKLTTQSLAMIALNRFKFHFLKFLALIFVCLSGVVSAQSLEFIRQATSPSSGHSNSFATAVDAAGNVYITGYFQGNQTFGSITLVSAGGFDVFIAKYDVSGNCLWAKRAGGTSVEYGYGIAVSGTSVYITGSFFGTANFNTPTATGSNEIISASGGGSDTFIAKYDDTGAFLWAKRAGGTTAAEEEGKAVAVIGTSVYITGTFNGTANFNTPSATGSNEITSAGFKDIYIAKYDETGTFQWAKRAGGASTDDVNGIAAIGTSIYITGFVFATANFNTPSTIGSNEIVSVGSSDIFIAKYDDTGTFQWAKRAGGTNSDEGNSIAASGTSVYITGSFFGTANFNSPSATGSNEIASAGSTDIFLAKYDESGTLLWAKRAGGTSIDTGYGISVSGTFVFLSGNFVGTANFNNPSATGNNTIVSAGGSDVFLAKYDDSGAFISAKRAGGTNDDVSLAVATSASSVYFTGYIKNTANFNNPSAAGTNELVGGSNGEAFIAKFSITSPPSFSSQPTNITICESANASISVVASDAISYQWQVFNGSLYTDLTNSNPFSNVTSSTLTITFPSNSLNGTVYRCVATGTAGVTNSNPATLTINTNVIAETAAITGETVTKKAGQNLTATNIISESANVNYSAGNFVLMNPGFQVQNGSIYSAIIQNNCN